MDKENVFPFYNLNDAEFIIVLHSDTRKYPYSVLNALVYCSNELYLTNHSVDHLNEEIIPQPECDYIFCTDGTRDIFPSNSLKIISYDISSISKHLEFFFEQCLNPFGVQIDVVGLCKTRLNDNIHNLFKLDNNFSFFQNMSN